MKRQTDPRSPADRAATVRSTRWAVAGLLAGLVAAPLLFAPASWLAWGLASATQQRLLLADARGSLWNGSARLVLSAGPGSRDASELPERLSWHLRPGWVDGAPGLRLALDQPCCARGDVALTWRAGLDGGRLRLPDTTPEQPWLQWPAAWLTGLGTPWNTLAPEGRLRLSAREFVLEPVQGRWQSRGLLALELQQLSSRLAQTAPLGSYRFVVQGGSPAQLQLLTLQGPLNLSGQGSLGARLQFRGEASAAPGSEAALANLLNIIGRRQGARSIISVG